MLGVAKIFGMTDKQVLYDMSYKNALMYSKVLPLPYDKNEDRPLFDESLDANNPANYNKFKDFEGEEIVRV